MKIINYFLVLAFVAALGASVSAQNQSRYGGSFAKGVELFYAQDYSGAVREFEKAEVDYPSNHAAFLWHGLAYAALGELDTKASNIWLKMPYDEKWKSTYRYFMGLGYWREGSTNNAKYWFKETINHPETPAAKLAQTALKSLLDDGEAPPITEWATLASLPGAKSAGKGDGGQTPPDVSAARNKTSPDINSPSPGDTETSPKSGARPSGGLWRGTISNGYTGQKISFRVSADGKTISAVAFEGYIRCSGSTESTRLAPLENVDVSGGVFSKTELQSPQIRFDFNGTFNGATTASGTYRIQSGTNCDTYALKWTASRSQ